jgi:hypothetical protein
LQFNVNYPRKNRRKELLVYVFKCIDMLIDSDIHRMNFPTNPLQQLVLVLNSHVGDWQRKKKNPCVNSDIPEQDLMWSLMPLHLSPFNPPSNAENETIILLATIFTALANHKS